MAPTMTHLAIADELYFALDGGVIKNLPLFFGGNIAPDAIHAKKDYLRPDKKRSHLCEGIRSYGYGYSEIAELFHNRVNEFINKYYFTDSEDKDLYLGYIVHLLVDEFYLLTIYKSLEEKLQSSGVDPDEPGFRRNLADAVNGGEYREHLSEMGEIYDISANEYPFKQNAADILGAAWDYEVKDFVGAAEINASKTWVINKYFKNAVSQNNTPINRTSVMEFIDTAAGYIIACLSGGNGIIKAL